MPPGDPILSANRAKLLLFKDGKKLVPDILVSAAVKPVSTKYQDKHIGNKTFKGDILVWGWMLNLKYHYYSDELIAAMLSYYEALQTPGAPRPVFSVILAVQEANAAARQPGYKFSPFFPDMDWEMPGLEERISQSLDGFAEKWTPFKSI
jgi:hypothetical protein